MVDLHSHYLFGVDDGAKDSDVTIKMLTQAESLGITKLLATPHVNDMTTPVIAHLIKNSFHDVYQLLRKAGISVKIKLAGEVNLLATKLDLEEYDWVLIGQQYKYMLVETPFHFLPDRYSKNLFDLRLQKIIPVLAHPERNIKLQNQPEQLVHWINQGCLVQIDAGSITGQFGNKCQRFAERLLRAHAVHVVGSDAHGPIGRNYHVLANAFKVVETLADNSYARLLFEHNPEAIWNGGKITELPIIESELHATGWNRLMDILNR